jgi:hypothetical protein
VPIPRPCLGQHTWQKPSMIIAGNDDRERWGTHERVASVWFVFASSKRLLIDRWWRAQLGNYAPSTPDEAQLEQLRKAQGSEGTPTEDVAIVYTTDARTPSSSVCQIQSAQGVTGCMTVTFTPPASKASSTWA